MKNCFNYVTVFPWAAQFTHDAEKDNKLAFLDVNIKKINNIFTINVYRKKTFTSLCSSFSSFVLFVYKVNLIKTLLFRAYEILLSNNFFLNGHNINIGPER